MKIYHVEESQSGRELATIVKPPFTGAEFVETSPCPVCGSERVHCLRGIRGEYGAEGKARCFDCGADRGRIVVEFGSVFGYEEDQRVLNGRCRVY